MTNFTLVISHLVSRVKKISTPPPKKIATFPSKTLYHSTPKKLLTPHTKIVFTSQELFPAYLPNCFATPPLPQFFATPCSNFFCHPTPPKSFYHYTPELFCYLTPPFSCHATPKIFSIHPQNNFAPLYAKNICHVTFYHPTTQKCFPTWPLEKYLPSNPLKLVATISLKKFATLHP